MRARITRSRRARTKMGSSTIVGGVIVLTMVLTVAYGFFYSINQDQQLFLRTSLQNHNFAAQSSREDLIVTGELLGPAVGFAVNNTGIATTIVSDLIIDSSTGQVLQINSGGGSTPALPYAFSQGQSLVFKTGVLYSPSKTYIIKLVTAKGSVFIGTYPPKQPSLNIVSSKVAAGLGSLSMVFSSYSFYTLSNQNNKWVIDSAHAQTGSLLPNGVQPAFSLKITNNDPSVGTITLNSHTDIYLYQQCQSGCGGNVPIYVYFAVDVASNGTVTSTNEGSFQPINIPYGATQIIYFASANDLSLGSFAPFKIVASNKAPLGEYDVFVVISGSDTTSQSAISYSQNLPFAGSYLADNVAWYSQNPVSCVHSAQTSFTLTVNNSVLSSNSIYQVSINASSFTNLLAPSPKIPSGWSSYVSSGTIIWNTSKISGKGISPGDSLTFSWNGTAPSSAGALVVFPTAISFAGGTVVNQQSASGCFIT